MRAVEMMREAWRDVAAGTARTFSSTAVLGVLWLSIGGTQAGWIGADVTAARHYRAAGANVYVETALGRIDGVACAALAGSDGIRAAGAMRSAAPLTPAALPNGPIPAVEVTVGFLDLLGVGAAADAAGVVVSEALGERLGVGPDDSIPLTDGQVGVNGVFAFPDDGRDPALQYAALGVSRPDGKPFDACWAELWPVHPAATTALQRTVLRSGSDDDTAPTLAQLNQTLGRRFEAGSVGSASAFRVSTCLVGGVVAFLGAWRRRGELAAARMLGVGVLPQTAILVLEHLVVVVLSSALTLVGVRVELAWAGVPQPQELLPTTYDTLWPAALVSLAGAALGVVVSRPSTLYRSFKER